MKIKRKLGLILFMIFLGCENHHFGENKVVKVTNRTRGIVADMLIADENRLLSIVDQHGRAKWDDISGIASRDDTAFLVSTDNNGKLLSEQRLGTNATWSIQKLDSSVYILKYSGDSTSIYRLNENGGQLNLILTSALYLRSIVEIESDVFICEARSQADGNYQLLAISKKEHSILDRGTIDQAFSHGNQIFELANDSVTNTHVFRELFKAEQKYASQIIFHYDKHVFPKVATISDGYIFTLCQKADRALLLRADMNGKQEIVRTFGSDNRIFPKFLHVFNDKVLVIVGERGTLSVKNHFYYSNDQGKNWAEIQLLNPDYSWAIAFYDNKKNNSVKCLFAVGDGRVEEFNF